MLLAELERRIKEESVGCRREPVAEKRGAAPARGPSAVVVMAGAKDAMIGVSRLVRTGVKSAAKTD